MISGSYFYAIGGFVPPQANAVNLTAALRAVATRDSDGDGLPDWEEALYGTNPHKVDTFGLGMTDGEAVAKGLIVPIAATFASTTPTTIDTNNGQALSSTSPAFAPAQGSITSIFAKDFLAAALSAKAVNGGQPLTKNQTYDIAVGVMQQVVNQMPPFTKYRTLSQISISDSSGPVALRNYVATIQKAFSENTIHENKVAPLYLQEAAKNNDPAALVHIHNISRMYSKAAASLAQISVPKEAAGAHLKLVNAFANMAVVTERMTKLYTDPIVALLAIPEYTKTGLSLESAYADLGRVFSAANVTATPGTPSARIINDAVRAANRQNATTTTTAL